VRTDPETNFIGSCYFNSGTSYRHNSCIKLVVFTSAVVQPCRLEIVIL